MKKTYRYINILLLINFLFHLSVLSANAQDNENEEFDPALWQGLRLDLDLASALVSLLSGGETYSYEAALQVNLKHKYFPVIEFGYAGADKKSLEEANYLCNGFFGKIGLDINMLKIKKEQDRYNFFTLGARVGMTNFKYDINNIMIEDDYWGGSEVYDYKDIKTTKFWFEIVAGIRVEALPNFYLGWNIRLKNTIGKDKNLIAPWYIPGFGKNNLSSIWVFNYTIGYRF